MDEMKYKDIDDLECETEDRKESYSDTSDGGFELYR